MSPHSVVNSYQHVWYDKLSLRWSVNVRLYRNHVQCNIIFIWIDKVFPRYILWHVHQYYFLWWFPFNFSFRFAYLRVVSKLRKLAANQIFCRNAIANIKIIRQRKRKIMEDKRAINALLIMWSMRNEISVCILITRMRKFMKSRD